MNKDEDKNIGNFLMIYYEILKIRAGKQFNMTDKMIWMVIMSLDNEEHCYAKNKYISDILGISRNTVTTSIGKLEDLGLITCEGNRQNRVIRSKLPKLPKSPSPKDLANFTKGLGQGHQRLWIYYIMIRILIILSIK